MKVLANRQPNDGQQFFYLSVNRTFYSSDLSSVTRPLNKREAGVDLNALVQTFIAFLM